MSIQNKINFCNILFFHFQLLKAVSQFCYQPGASSPKLYKKFPKNQAAFISSSIDQISLEKKPLLHTKFQS